MTQSEKCAVSGCRRDYHLTVLGIPICSEHWDQHCDGNVLVLKNGNVFGQIKRHAWRF